MISFIGDILSALIIALHLFAFTWFVVSRFRKWNRGSQYKENARIEIMYPCIFISIFQLVFTYKVNLFFNGSIVVWSLFSLFLIIVSVSNLNFKRKEKEYLRKKVEEELKNKLELQKQTDDNLKKYHNTNEKTVPNNRKLTAKEVQDALDKGIIIMDDKDF
jgi:hypothetical protein